MWFIFLDPLPEAPKLGASRGPLFTISGLRGRAEEVHHPLPGHRPYISQRFRNLSKSNPTRRHPPLPGYRLTHKPTLCIRMYPTKTHQPNESECIPLKSLSRTAHHASARRQSHLVLILVSLLACKCPGSSPGSHNPCSSHTFAPTTSRDLGSSLPTAGGILCNLVNQL